MADLKRQTGWTASGLRSLLAPAKGRGKGGNFERDMARDFSLWWSRGDRDDIFWRTGGSGGRATARSKAGKQTAGQYGDVAATDAYGVPFIQWATVELKRGYQQVHIGDLFDRTATTKQTGLAAFFEQAINSHREAGSTTWMVVHARDRRTPMVWLPVDALQGLEDAGAIVDKDAIRPRLIFNGQARINGSLQPLHVVGFPLQVFFDVVLPMGIPNAI